jgi:hypothetical protein
MGKRDNNGECNKIRIYLLYWLRLDSGGRLRPYGNIRFYIRHALNSRHVNRRAEMRRFKLAILVSQALLD